MAEAEGAPLRAVLPWVIFTSVIFLVTYQARAIFGPLLPYIEAEFAMTHAQATRYQLYISLGYSASMFATIYTSTKVRYRLLAGGASVATGLVLGLIAWLPGSGTLAVLCCLLGIVTGQYFNAGMGTLRTLVRLEDWSKTVAIHEFGPNLSFFFCPIIAGFGAAYVGWRGVVALIGVVAFVVGVVYIFRARGGDVTSPPFFFKGLKRLLRNPVLWVFIWFMSLMIGGQFGPYSILMLHLTEDAGFSSQTASMLLSFSRLSAPFAALMGGFLTMRVGTVKALATCLTLHSLSLFCLAADYELLKIAALFVQPMMAAMTAPACFTLVAQRFPARKQSMVLAIGMPVASFVGTGAVPWVLGYFGTYVSFNTGFVLLGGITALSLLVLRAVARAQR